MICSLTCAYPQQHGQNSQILCAAGSLKLRPLATAHDVECARPRGKADQGSPSRIAIFVHGCLASSSRLQLQTGAHASPDLRDIERSHLLSRFDQRPSAIWIMYAADTLYLRPRTAGCRRSSRAWQGGRFGGFRPLHYGIGERRAGSRPTAHYAQDHAPSVPRSGRGGIICTCTDTPQNQAAWAFRLFPALARAPASFSSPQMMSM